MTQLKENGSQDWFTQKLFKCDESNRQELRGLMPLASNVYSYIDAHDSTLAVGCLKSDHLEIRRRHFPMYSFKDMCAEVG